MSIKTVLFDLDDTLYGDFKTCDQAGFAAAGACAEARLGIPAGRFAEALREGKKRLHDRVPEQPESHDRVLYAQTTLEMLGYNPICHAQAIADAYWQAVLDRMELREGVHELLDTLRARGVRVGVCTNMLADVQMRKLVLLGLAERIDFLVTSEEAGLDKPGSAIFRLALEKAGCQPEEALMVGDNYRHDIWGAHQVGIPGIWLHVNGEAAPDGQVGAEAASFPEAAEKILARLANQE